LRTLTFARILLVGASLAVSICTSHADVQVGIDISGGVPGAPSPQRIAQHNQRIADIAALGRRLFFERNLSASGQLACASCHDPAHAFGPPDARPVRSGGRDMQQPGTRSIPSLRYLQTTPPFTEHYAEDEGPRPGDDNGPTGGFTFDGRADTLRAQARIPLFAAHEMANTDVASLVARVQQAGYADEFQRLFGADIFDRPEQALDALTMSLEYFQQSPADFYPYSSKYDAFLRGQAALSPREKRGLALFNNAEKGNCASCHPSERGANGAFPQFTDFGYAALAVPRNGHIPANAARDYYDLGLCGPERKDLADNKAFCGLFKVPSLRNVASKQVFFHNGVMTDLRQVVRFYAERDVNPEKWYPHANSIADKYDDLPQRYWDNIERGAPFLPQANGKPRLNEHEIDDIVAFLKTLDDGYRVKR
jgi:cytochrome c peroxidase